MAKSKTLIKSAVFLLCLLMLASNQSKIAFATQYVTLSGQITNSAGMPLQPPSIALARVSTGEIVGNLDSQGRYSINVPSGSPIDLTFVIYEEGSLNSSGQSSDVNRINPGFSNWTTKFTGLQEDRVINFKLPQFFQLEVKVTDAQSILLNNVVLTMPDLNQSHNPYLLDGITWTGIQRSASSGIRYISKDGTFIFQFYPTDNFKGFAFWQTTDLNNPSQGSGITYSPTFPIVSNKSIQLCVPVNFGSTKTTPPSCLDNQLAAAKATPTPTPTPSATPTPTRSATPSATPTPTSSATPSASPKPTPSATPKTSSAGRKKTNWLYGCPEEIDETPQLPAPKTMVLTSPSGQTFKLLAKDSVDYVDQPQSILGCYVVEENVVNSELYPAWQIGAVRRDVKGFYFINQANITWRLTLNTQNSVLETEPGSHYYRKGAGFVLGTPIVAPTPTPTPTSDQSSNLQLITTSQQAGTYYQESTACHSNQILASLQLRIEQEWQDVAFSRGWITVTENCFQPWTVYRAIPEQSLRWRLADRTGAWEVFSPVFNGNRLASSASDSKQPVTESKKSSITCTKGKLTKKVSAVKPKCPSGYKKK